MAAGDPQAPAAFQAQYEKLLHWLARTTIGPGPDAEDAVQDILIELWKTAERYDPAKGKESTWVTTLARRRLVDRLRRRGRQPDIEHLPEALSDHDQGLDHVEVVDEASRALAALEQLPPARKEVVTQAVLEGRSHVEIAARSGLPLGTVKSHVRRGLARLRDLLDEDDGAED